MKRSVEVLLAAALMAAVASPAAAQARRTASTQVPDTGMTALGLTIGASIPTDDTLDTGLDLGAQLERYLSPRLSVRAKLSGAWFDITGRPFTGTMEPIAIEGNVVHNWEHGVWHPYVTGGIGIYHYKFTEGGADSSDNKFGINFGGGAEYFLTRHDTVLAEALIRVVPGRANSLTSEYETHYWTLMGGYKKYF